MENDNPTTESARNRAMRATQALLAEDENLEINGQSSLSPLSGIKNKKRLILQKIGYQQQQQQFVSQSVNLHGGYLSNKSHQPKLSSLPRIIQNVKPKREESFSQIMQKSDLMQASTIDPREKSKSTLKTSYADVKNYRFKKGYVQNNGSIGLVKDIYSQQTNSKKEIPFLKSTHEFTNFEDQEVLYSINQMHDQDYVNASLKIIPNQYESLDNSLNFIVRNRRKKPQGSSSLHQAKSLVKIIQQQQSPTNINVREQYQRFLYSETIPIDSDLPDHSAEINLSK